VACNFNCRIKTRVPTLLRSVDLYMMIGLVVLKQYYARHTDEQTNRQTDRISIALCIAVWCWRAIITQ